MRSGKGSRQLVNWRYGEGGEWGGVKAGLWVDGWAGGRTLSWSHNRRLSGASGKVLLS